ncbi:class I SAM-dependent methyltransferase [Rhodosalinus halophilus]|uniref:Class I SAM-dependent methyltransferase n=1 Tax=Rhodosalinus halophilus TaxID=2259333 RepID=A0A365UDN6_9RHOB|nr:class I SAM-dependent methyltransferase [Rhodosalinus halophilus]RBI87656.1 class I SAM-dependent methyltransferase [Rhodosalinus halophilus]
MTQGADVERTVAAHYGSEDLTARILTALGIRDTAPASLHPDRLAPVDQLHHGGLSLTERLADVAGVAQGMTVLDAGSGIGGAARYLAARHGCRVEAIDLSPDFVRSAQDLDRLTGLDTAISHRVGSVTGLPWADGTFDVVWSQNVTMNVADKSAMFAEAFRVLRPVGVFAFTHIARGTNTDAIDYPLPWARTGETSFLSTPAEIGKLLAAAGFVGIADHASDAPRPAPPATPDQPDDSVAMGADMPQRRANAGRAVADGRLVPMMVTARRP